jgi:hypothetical protein
MKRAASVRLRDVVPSYAVFVAMMALGGHFVEEWHDHGGLLRLIAGTALLVFGLSAGIVFSVRWWQVTHRGDAPPTLSDPVTEAV